MKIPIPIPHLPLNIGCFQHITQHQHHHQHNSIMDKEKFGYLGYICDICLADKLMDTWWPWGAGMFATSLGPDDACFVVVRCYLIGLMPAFIFFFLQSILDVMIHIQ